MDIRDATANASQDTFWTAFLNRLREQGVKPNVQRWYVVRVEEYLRANEGSKPAEHSAETVNSFLAEAGRNSRLQDWQFQQIVDAIQNWIHVTNTACYQKVDWLYWKSSARSLSEMHPTIAREATILPSTRPKGQAPLIDKASKRHGEVLDRLVTDIRSRHYSIRTEQAYLGWVCRYLIFIGNRKPEECGAAEINAFLQKLAVNDKVSASTQNQALNARFSFIQI